MLIGHTKVSHTHNFFHKVIHTGFKKYCIIFKVSYFYIKGFRYFIVNPVTNQLSVFG